MNEAEAGRVINEFKADNPSILYFGKILGKGAYGQIRDVKLKDSQKIMAAKLIRKDDDDKLGEINYVNLLKNPNIIKINQVLTKQVSFKTYYLIIMEKAMLRDLGKLSEFYFRHNLLKLINENSFDEQIGDNLLRFYAKQIINAMKCLDDNYLVHFDIKPENLLITINLMIKLSDFGLLTKIKDKNEIRIPGGTQGFLTREYYKKDKVSNEDAKKQDYFSLGSTLFYLKFGEHMLKYQDRIVSKLILQIFAFIFIGSILLYLIVLSFELIAKFIVIPIKNVQYMLQGINVGGGFRLDFLKNLQKKQEDNLEKLNKINAQLSLKNNKNKPQDK